MIIAYWATSCLVHLHFQGLGMGDGVSWMALAAGWVDGPILFFKAHGILEAKAGTSLAILVTSCS